MRIPLTLFLILIWTFLILAPLKTYAKDIAFSCKPVVTGTMRTRFLDFLILVAIGKVGHYLVVMAATDWSLSLF